MMSENQKVIINKIVRDYLLKNVETIEKVQLTDEVIQHVINCGTDLLAKEWGLQSYCGSFIQAILNNDLRDTFTCADDVNTQFIKFYLLLKNNVNCPKELFV